ncbi:MAG: hypothetical protein V1902_02095 [Candidatus Falkowbacteria bacterium]
MKPDVETTTHLGSALIEKTLPLKQQKRPRPHTIALPESIGETIAAIYGKKDKATQSGNGWVVRIFLQDARWLARTNTDEVRFGADLVCFVNRQPRTATDVVHITRVFKRFCVGEVVTIN